MAKAKSKYRRCKTCKQLISAHHEDCPNCAARNPLAMTRRDSCLPGAKRKPDLDVIEGNWND